MYILLSLNENFPYEYSLKRAAPTKAKFSLSTIWKNIGGGEVLLHSFLTLALDGGGWLTSRASAALPPGKKPGTHWVGKLGGFQRRSERFTNKEKPLAPIVLRTPDRPARTIQSVDLQQRIIPSTTTFCPHKENPHGRAGNRTQDLVISSQKLWPLDHEAGLCQKVESGLLVPHIPGSFSDFSSMCTNFWNRLCAFNGKLL